MKPVPPDVQFQIQVSEDNGMCKAVEYALDFFHSFFYVLL